MKKMLPRGFHCGLQWNIPYQCTAHHLYFWEVISIYSQNIFFLCNNFSISSIFREFPTEFCLLVLEKSINPLDCTHAKIQAPSIHEPDYVNRKGTHSINVQCITDHMYRFLNVETRLPGSTHEFFILNNSPANALFENLLTTVDKGIILGYSGYPLRSWLLTPYAAPNTPSERAYNRSHKSTRSSGECL